MLYRFIAFLVSAAVIIGLGEWDARTHRLSFTDRLNEIWLDFCIGNAHERFSEPEVTFIGIGDKYEPLFPDEGLSRLDYAVMMTNLDKFNPKAVTIVPTLHWETPNSINQDLLKDRSLQMPRMTLGCVVENSSASDPAQIEARFPKIPKESVTGDVQGLAAFTRVVAFPDDEVTVNGALAFSHIELDEASSSSAAPAAADANESDGLRFPLIARVGETVTPSLVLHTLLAYENLTVEDVRVDLTAQAGGPFIQVGDRYTIPVDASGRMKLYEQAGIVPDEFFPVLGAEVLPLAGTEDVDVQALQEAEAADIESLKENAVILGLDQQSARSYSLSEDGATGGKMVKVSQANIFARLLSTIQSGRYIELWPQWAKFVGLGLIVVLAAWVFRFSQRRALVAGAIVTFLFMGGCILIFKSALLWTPPFTQLALFALMLVIALALPHHAKTRAKAEAEATSPASGTQPSEKDEKKGESGAKADADVDAAPAT